MLCTKALIQQSFDKASSTYDAHNQVQQRVASELLHKCKSLVSHCSWLLDLGCGPGVNSRALSEISQHYIGMDLSPNMLTKARQGLSAHNDASDAASMQFLQGDMDNLPFADECLDVVFSSLAIQWSANPTNLFKHIERVLKPGGQAFISTLLSGTLEPLRSLRYQIDSVAQGHQQPPFEFWRNALSACQDLTLIDREVIEFKVFSADLHSLLMGIKGVGAGAPMHNGSDVQPRPLSVSVYRQLAQRYEAYRTLDGLPLNYQVVFLCLKKRA